MQENVKKTIRITVGVILLGLGIVGLALPVLQGWLTIFAGLYILFPEDTTIGRKIRTWVRKRRSEMHKQLEARREKRKRISRPF
jgi:uncharacterized membrane protein YbaN (DUF454 family)